MLDPLPLAPVLSLAGLVLLAAGVTMARRSEARVGTARRLAGAREMRVADLFDLGQAPARPVRVAGRIRCPDPMVTTRDDRLVAVHRDVDVRLPGHGWRAIERLRETRGIELWDHGGSLPLDLSQAAEPLITIPRVWRGDPSELDADYRPAIDRLSTNEPPTEARSVTRMISVVDRLLVLARVELAPDGAPRLLPPEGGFVVAAVELDAAMRLLAGPRRLLAVLGIVTVLVGAVLLLAAAAVGVGLLATP